MENLVTPKKSTSKIGFPLTCVYVQTQIIVNPQLVTPITQNQVISQGKFVPNNSFSKVKYCKHILKDFFWSPEKLLFFWCYEVC